MPSNTRSQTQKKSEIDQSKLNLEQVDDNLSGNSEKANEQTDLTPISSGKNERSVSFSSVDDNKLEPSPTAINDMELMGFIGDIETFNGLGDAREWFHGMNTSFTQLRFSFDIRLKAIPYLLQNDALIWFSFNEEKITSYTQFCKLFAENYFEPNQSTTTETANVPDCVPIEKTTGTARPDPSTNSAFTSTITKALVDKFVKDPLKFAGSADNVSSWLEEIEQQFNLMQLTDSDRLNLIHICLKHEALHWYRENKNKFTSWSIFIDEINKSFQSRMKQDKLFEKLKRYRQTSNQSVTQYYLDMVKLMEEADPDMNESTKIHYLINGLLPSLSIETRRNYPTNCEQFLVNAKVAEELTAYHSYTPTCEFLNDTPSTISFYSNPSEFNGNYRKTEPNNHHVQNDYSQFDQQQQFVNQIGKSMPIDSSQGYSYRPTSHDSTTSKFRQNSYHNHSNRNNNHKQQPKQQQQQDQQQGQSTRRCFKCGSSEHLARQCNHFQNRSQ